ncbi:MAG: DUF1579 family protein [Dokdonella sp.]
MTLQKALFISLSMLAVSSSAFSATPPSEVATVISADVYLPLTLEAGTWDADVTFFTDGKPVGHDIGVQVNELLGNGHWITNDFRIAASKEFPAYQGHGVWGYDTVAKTYVDTWVDTNDLSVRTDYGFWQADKQIMTWSSKQSDGKGHFVDYRMIEEFKGEKRSLAIYQLGLATPVEHLLIKMDFTRRPASVKSK